MNYLTTENGTPEPINLRQWLRAKSKDTGTSYPEFWSMDDAATRDARLAELGVHPYTIVPRPDVGSMQRVEAGPIEQINGAWVQGWNIVDATAEVREGAELDRFTLAENAAKAGYVTYAEAAQWAAGNAIPASVQAVIDALPAAAQGPTTLDMLARPTIRRNASLIPALMAAFQTDDAGVDALYGLV